MYADPATDAEQSCWRQYDDVLHTLRSLGFLSNDDKNESPTQSITFLGGGLDTNTGGTGACSMYVPEDKRQRVITACSAMAHATKVHVRELMALLGLLMFCSNIVHGTKLYLRSGFDLIKGKQPSEMTGISRRFKLDLQYLVRLYKLALPRTMLTRRMVSTTFGSWDASTSWGMGGFLDGRYFSEKWSTFLSNTDCPTFYPKEGTPTFHINYLELFAGYWFLKLWGATLQGCTIVCHTDNTVTESMLRRMWGKTTFIPLLKEIQVLLVKYDVALSPQRISTDDNTLSDCLSRGAFNEYEQELHKLSQMSPMDKDMEDWQMMPEEVQQLNQEFGPFDVDACTDEYRTNAHFTRSWNKNDDCTKQRWHNLNVFCNGPFSLLLQILMHAAWCKQAQPVGTAALFIVPFWPNEEFYRFAMSLPKMFKVVRRWPKGTILFTATKPSRLGGGRLYNGPTRWPVVAFRMGPAAECA